MLRDSIPMDAMLFLERKMMERRAKSLHQTVDKVQNDVISSERQRVEKSQAYENPTLEILRLRLRLRSG